MPMGKMYNATKKNAVRVIASALKKNVYKKRAWRRRALRQYAVPKTKQVHYHVRRIATGTETNFSIDTSGGLGEYLRGASFKLSDLQQYGELTALYDRYMITKVVLDFQWTITATSGSGPNASYAPQLNLIKDYTDASTPSSGDFREQSVIRKRLTANNPFRISLTPAVSQAIYQSAVSTGYGPKWKTQIAMSDWAVPHYGVKYQIICPQTNVGFIQVTAKYYVSCYDSS